MILGLKPKLKYIFWITFSLFIGFFLASTISKTIGYEPISQTNTNINKNETIKEDETPKLFYFIKDPKKQPKIKAEAYLVGDLDTGEIILAKNKDQQFPIASVSKLMTAVVSEDIQNKSEIAQISKKTLATYGENGNLRLNEKIKTGDLIYPLLLESSNDAAEALAEKSGRDTFIEKMNEKSKELGLFLTSFEDPSGLSENNHSTATDLFKFAKYLKINKPDLLTITTKKSFNNKIHTWFNNSQFLNFEGYIGGKRGYIDESKQTALSIFSIPISESGARNIGIIVLRSPDRYKDVSNIFNYLKKNIYYGMESDKDTEWVKQKEGTVEDIEPNFVTLLFGGDIMLDRGVKNSVMKNFGGDYSLMFENLNLLKSADIVFANLEGPASDKGSDRKNLYSFRMDPSVIPALKGSGFDILSVANNHAGDWGRDAYADTLARLKENEISYTGGGINKNESEQPVVIEKYGIKIGYLGFSDVGPNMPASESNAGLLLTSNPRFDEIIQNASKQVDHLIVSFHFGEEYKIEHNNRQEYLAHKAIDDGAKIIIGTHPHVVEDTEVYKNGFIAYSLGNFIFDQYFSENTMQGMLLEIKLEKNGSMTIKKNTVNLSKVFQPEKITKGKEENIKFQEFQKIEQ
ncbi:MAG: CapA family protein [Minisyncoccia bacterium]